MSQNTPLQAYNGHLVWAGPVRPAVSSHVLIVTPICRASAFVHSLELSHSSGTADAGLLQTPLGFHVILPGLLGFMKPPCSMTYRL